MIVWTPRSRHRAVTLRRQGENLHDRGPAYGKRRVTYGVIKGTERVVFRGDGIERVGNDWIVIPRERLHAQTADVPTLRTSSLPDRVLVPAIQADPLDPLQMRQPGVCVRVSDVGEGAEAAHQPGVDAPGEGPSEITDWSQQMYKLPTNHACAETPAERATPIEPSPTLRPARFEFGYLVPELGEHINTAGERRTLIRVRANGGSPRNRYTELRWLDAKGQLRQSSPAEWATWAAKEQAPHGLA